MSERDCPTCGHSGFSHHSGICSVAGSFENGKMVEYPDGCGCKQFTVNKTCTVCSKMFFCPDLSHGPHECWSCSYGGQIKAAEDAFRPLTEALQRRLEVTPTIYQSGGMVMLLEVPAGRDGRCAMFSEFGWYETASFSLYEDWDNGDDVGVNFLHPTLPDEPEHAEAIAEWAAPLILQWAQGPLPPEMMP